MRRVATVTTARNIRTTAVVVVASILAVAGCSTDPGSSDSIGSGPSDDIEPVTLAVSHPLSPGAFAEGAIVRMLDYVKEKTDGTVDYEIYPGSQLHPANQGLAAVESGLVDIAFHAHSFYPDDLPIGSWMIEPIGALTGENWLRSAMANAPAMQAVYEESDEVREELARFNAMPLINWGQNPGNMLCTKPIETADQAQGVLVKSSGGPVDREVETLGMVTTYVDHADEYEALQRGVIDCTAGVTLPNHVDTGIWEVAKYDVPVQLSPSLGTGWIFSLDTWQSLPLTVQQMFHDAKPLHHGHLIRETLGGYQEWAREAPGMGITTLDATELNARLAELQEVRLAEGVEGAPEGMEDPQKVLDIFAETASTFEQTLENDLDIPAGPISENMAELYASVGDVDWDAYESAMREVFEKYRPSS